MEDIPPIYLTEFVTEARITLGTKGCLVPDMSDLVFEYSGESWFGCAVCDSVFVDHRGSSYCACFITVCDKCRIYCKCSHSHDNCRPSCWRCVADKTACCADDATTPRIHCRNSIKACFACGQKKCKSFITEQCSHHETEICIDCAVCCPKCKLVFCEKDGLMRKVHARHYCGKRQPPKRHFVPPEDSQESDPETFDSSHEPHCEQPPTKRQRTSLLEYTNN